MNFVVSFLPPPNLVFFLWKNLFKKFFWNLFMNNNVNMHYLLFRLMYIRPLMSVYFQTTIKFRFSFLAECYSLNSTICATFIIFAYFKLHDLFINRHKEMHKVDYQDYKFLNRSEMTCTIVDDWVMGTDIYVLSTVN